MRNAWLIISHNEFDILQQLISALDAPENDIYLHFDKKLSSIPVIHTKEAHLVVLKDRVDVRWGTISQIQTELLLLEKAHQSGPYAHYHILSGVHLPLKPLDQIVQFYDSHLNEEIGRFWPEDEGEADFKMRRYHFPVRDFKNPIPWRRNLCQRIWTAVIKLQKIIGVRHLKKCSFHKTDQWLSITEKACSFLLSHKREIIKKYKWTFCPDEYVIASELIEQPVGQFKWFDCQQLLFVEFDRESPKAISLSRLPELQKTEYWWARKFTSTHAD